MFLFVCYIVLSKGIKPFMCDLTRGATRVTIQAHITSYHLTLFLSIPDAYDDSDVIFKWKNADVHVSRDNMAQFQFMGASFTSNQDSYLNGKNKQSAYEPSGLSDRRVSPISVT